MYKHDEKVWPIKKLQMKSFNRHNCSVERMNQKMVTDLYAAQQHVLKYNSMTRV
jgi:hypothetical protein